MEKDILHITTYQSGIMQSSAHRLLGRIKTDYLDQYELTAMQWFVIGHVYDAGEKGIRLNDLMKIIDTTMPFITTIITLLESKGIIYKTSDINDSRIKIATLNPKYRRTVKKIEEGLSRELCDRLVQKGQVSLEELQTYISVLYKITQTAR